MQRLSEEFCISKKKKQCKGTLNMEQEHWKESDTITRYI